ncbi:MAG: DUF5723 family protein [Bacteroidia bacterium]|nr:DUF5723 family protein [Bacteroidia bacterium]
MTGKTKYFLMMLITAVCLDATSQNSQVLYYMKLPQNHLLNPAIRPSDKFYIGLPVITGINTEFGNNFLQVSDILPSGTKINSLFFKTLNLNKLAGKLRDRNTITTDESIQLLGLGLSFGKDLYIFLDVVDKINAKTILPRDLLELYLTEPPDFIGKTFDLSMMNMQTQYYREYGLGFSKNVTKNLRIGAKVKLLSGIASASLDNKSLTMKVNSDFSQAINADTYLNVSGKETLQRIFTYNHILGHPDSTDNGDLKGFAFDYLKIPVSNVGAALDIGAVYNLGKFFTFSASVTDLGFINWKHDLKSYYSKDTIHLTDLTLKEAVNNPDYDIKNFIHALVDTIRRSFKDTIPKSFRTYLPTGISAGVSINLLPVISLGVLSNTKFYAGTVRESVTLSANAYLGRILSASVSYTIANYSYNNLGFGLAFKTGSIVQFYVIADKIPLNWGKVYIEKGHSGDYLPIPEPQSMNLFNLSIGMNIVFGKPVTKKTDRPMIVIQ